MTNWTPLCLPPSGPQAPGSGLLTCLTGCLNYFFLIFETLFVKLKKSILFIGVTKRNRHCCICTHSRVKTFNGIIKSCKWKYFSLCIMYILWAERWRFHTLLWSASMPKSEQRCSTNMSYSTNESGSSRSSSLSRAVSLPCAQDFRALLRLLCFHSCHVSCIHSPVSFHDLPFVLCSYPQLSSSCKRCLSFLLDSLLHWQMADRIASCILQNFRLGKCPSVRNLTYTFKRTFQTV